MAHRSLRVMYLTELDMKMTEKYGEEIHMYKFMFDDACTGDYISIEPHEQDYEIDYAYMAEEAFGTLGEKRVHQCFEFLREVFPDSYATVLICID